MQPDEALSAHFNLHEFTVSREAAARGIRNEPLGSAVAGLRRLAALMERVRAALGGVPITIVSGYRCPALNAAVGGQATSAHMRGLAADFIAPRAGSPRELCRRIVDAGIVFDQLIEEGGWVHIGLADAGKPPREEVLTARFRAGQRPLYIRGLV